MVEITEKMIRSRSEHNECIISSLEEISLHQQEITKITNIDKWCKKLKIVYLQSNLISKIENVSRLKSLVYLNLAQNNIEKIEGLRSCECLEKLDLLLNFIGTISNIQEELGGLYKLNNLYLTGNPIVKFGDNNSKNDDDGDSNSIIQEGSTSDYRQYIIAALQNTSLSKLDGLDVSRKDKILALQYYNDTNLHQKMKLCEEQHLKKRQQEKSEYQIKNDQREEYYRKLLNDPELTDVDKIEDPFIDAVEAFTPEAKLAAAEHLAKKKEISDKIKEDHRIIKEPKREKREIRFYNNEGKPLNINPAKIQFNIIDDFHGLTDEKEIIQAMWHHPSRPKCAPGLCQRSSC